MAFSATLVATRLSTLPRPQRGSGELFFRSVNYLFVKGMGANVLTGAYAGLNGGRYNPADGNPVCYLAASQTNAAFEVEQEQMLLGLGAQGNPAPRLTLGVTVEGAVWLDLCNPLVCKHLGLASDASDLFMPSADWKALNRRGLSAPTQEVGALSRAAGFEACAIRRSCGS